MRIKTKLKALAVASALLGSTAAMAAPLPISLVTPDGTINNWAGIDWATNGTAAITGFNTSGSPFQLTMWGNAGSLYVEGGATVTTPNLYTGLGSTGSYEYTILGSITESASCIGTNCTFTVLGGSFNVYFDTTADGNYRTGAGMTDGTLLFSGTVGLQPGGSFLATSPTDGFGVAVLDAMINYTDSTYINPELAGSNTTTTLQIGRFVTSGWTPGTTMPDVGGGTKALPAGTFELQADMNSGVTSVPEPASLALAGLALFGLGMSRRNKSA